jgi:serine/threonine-protein kinase
LQAVLPKRIGRYEVLGQLAAGGMAEILLARLSGPGDFRRAVVIKRVLRSYAGNASFVKMFFDEARIVATIRHPNVVHVQELGEDEGGAFLVMEYVAGENVASVQKRAVAAGTPFDPRLAAHVLAETCAGLHAAHELVDERGRPQNLVHRDVSPQNVLVGYDGHVKLVDFGVALVENRDARTEPGEVKGKFEYMSPEQGLGKPLDRRSDIFSAGVVLYELSTGRRLFKRASAARTIEAVCREPVVPPSRVASGYPPALEAVVMRALAKDPAQRYATAADMRRDLLDVARELPNPVEALAEQMRALFADRIAEKEEMLRRVGEGAEVSHVPAGDAPAGDVVVPDAPEAPKRGAASRVIVAGAVASVLLATGATFAILVKVSRGPLTSKDEPAASAVGSAPPESPPKAGEVVVRIDSKPSGARVRVAGEDRGETPIELHLPRGEDAVNVELRRTGYAPIVQAVVPDADQKIIVGLSPLPMRTRGPSSRPIAKPPSPPPPPAGSSGFRRFD